MGMVSTDPWGWKGGANLYPGVSRSVGGVYHDVGGGGAARVMCIRYLRMVLLGVFMVYDLEWRWSGTRPYVHGMPGLLVGGNAYNVDGIVLWAGSLVVGFTGIAFDLDLCYSVAVN